MKPVVCESVEVSYLYATFMLQINKLLMGTKIKKLNSLICVVEQWDELICELLTALIIESTFLHCIHQ